MLGWVLAGVLATSPMPSQAAGLSYEALDLGEPPKCYRVDGDTFFHSQFGRFVALDWRTFRQRWVTKLPQGLEAQEVLDFGDLLVLNCRKYDGELSLSGGLVNRETYSWWGIPHVMALRKSDGKVLWLNGKYQAFAKLIQGSHWLGVQTEPSLFLVLDPRTGRTIWSQSFSEELSRISQVLAIAESHVLVKTDEHVTVLEAKSGKPIWINTDRKHLVSSEYAAVDELLFESILGTRLSRIDPVSRRVYWSRPSCLVYGRLLQPNRILLVERSDLVCIREDTGKELWRVSLNWGIERPDFMRSFGETLVIRNNRTLRVEERGDILYIDPRNPLKNRAIARSPEEKLVLDERFLRRYRSEARRKTPRNASQRKLLARSLASQFRLLDDTDRKLLGTLGSTAVDALLEMRPQVSDAVHLWDDQPMEAWVDLIVQALGTQDSIRLTPLALELPGRQSDRLLEALYEKGDPEVMIPFAIQVVRGDYDEVFEKMGPVWARPSPVDAAEFLTKRSVPGALAPICEFIASPRCPWSYRFAGASELIWNFGDAAIPYYDALFKDRSQLPTPLERLNAGIREYIPPRTEFETYYIDGRHWVEIHEDSIQGSNSGVIARTEEGWRGNTTPTLDAYAPVKADLRINTRWHSFFIKEMMESQTDTDKDGLYDLTEASLKLNSESVDTDGDGV